MKIICQRGRSGFTMPEVVFAAVLLGAGLSIFMTAFTFAAKCVYDARNQMIALNNAREQVENRRVYTYRAPQLALGTYSTNTGVYNATVVISNVRTNEKQISASVVWTNYALRAPCTATYVSVIADAVH